MDKKKLVLIIVGTLLAMALVATALVLWLLPKGNGAGEDPTQTTSGAVIDDQNGEEGNENQDATQGGTQEPTVGVEVEIPDETTGNSGNSGNSGSTGNSGNSGSSGDSDNGNNQEIDFDDLLGAG